MVSSSATTVSEYLQELPDDRREAIETVRSEIVKNLPPGFEEVMQYGMISYVVPLSRYPAGYLNDKKTPLPFVSLASQKNHMAVYMMHVYGDPALQQWFEEEYKKSGKKMDMGKSCIRFKKLENLPVDLIGETVGKITVDEYIEMYEQARKK